MESTQQYFNVLYFLDSDTSSVTVLNNKLSPAIYEHTTDHQQWVEIYRFTLKTCLDVKAKMQLIIVIKQFLNNNYNIYNNNLLREIFTTLLMY